MEKVNIKEEIELIERLETEILEKSKALEEIERKLKKEETTITKKKVLEGIWWARNIRKTKNKKQKQKKLKKVNKIEETEKVIGKQEIRTELIKDTTKNKEWLRIERINRLRRNRRNQISNKRTKDRKTFNELDIRLIKVFK